MKMQILVLFCFLLTTTFAQADLHKQTKITKILADQMNKKPLSKKFQGTLLKLVAERDRAPLQKAFARWKPAAADTTFEAKFGYFYVNYKKQTIATFRVIKENPLTILMNDKNSFTVDKRDIAGSVNTFLKGVRKTAEWKKILQNILLDEAQAQDHTVSSSVESWLGLEATLLTYSTGQIIELNNSQDLESAFKVNPNSEPWAIGEIQLLNSLMPKWATESSMTCDGSRLSGEIKIKDTRMDFDFNEDVLNLSKNGKQYRVQLTETNLPKNEIWHLANSYTFLRSKLLEKVPQAEREQFQTDWVNFLKNNKAGTWFSTYDVKEKQAIDKEISEVQRLIDRRDFYTTPHFESTFMRGIYEAAYQRAYGYDHAWGYDDQLQQRNKRALQETLMFAERGGAERYFYHRGRQNFEDQQIAKVDQILKAKMLAPQECIKDKCFGSDRIFSEAFGLTPNTPKITDAQNKIKENEDAIEKLQNKFKADNNLPEVLKLKSVGEGFVLSPTPPSTISGKDLEFYKDKLIALAATDTLLSLRLWTLKDSETDKSEDLKSKRKEYEEALAKSIYNLKALSLCCKDNECRAQFYKQTNINLKPTKRAN
jgi:hypothetical protein